MTTPACTETMLMANYFCAAFLAAHNAFILVESLALAAALILPLPFLAAGFVPLIFAQRALAAAEILALAAALILNFFFGDGLAERVTVEPNNWLSSFSSD